MSERTKWLVDRVCELVERTVGWWPVKPDSVSTTPETRLAEDMGADSLDMVELCLAVEEEFDIGVADSEATKWITVGDVVTTVWKELYAEREAQP